MGLPFVYSKTTLAQNVTGSPKVGWEIQCHWLRVLGIVATTVGTALTWPVWWRFAFMTSAPSESCHDVVLQVPNLAGPSLLQDATVRQNFVLDGMAKNNCSWS